MPKGEHSRKRWRLARGVRGVRPDWTIRDTRMVERALRQDWPIPPERRPDLIEHIMGLVTDKENCPREQISAFNALLNAGRLSLGQQRVDLGLDDPDQKRNLTQIDDSIPDVESDSPGAEEAQA